MIRSMTGYGRYREDVDGFDLNIDIRSVNHRYFDLSIRLPKYYGFLEDKIRERLSKSIKRGKVELGLYIKRKDLDEKIITLNEPLCDNYISVLTKLKEKLNSDERVSINSLIRFNDIFEIEYVKADEEKIEESVLYVLDKCISDFVSMRQREGERIQKDLEERLFSIKLMSDEIALRAPQIINDYRERLTLKLKELLNDIDEQRILQEAAIYADKITTVEETIRLNSHIKEFTLLLKKSGGVGKKLDFIVQEMNREANTIGSKCNDAATSKLVVDLKSQIENIREQIQNIE